MKIEQKLTKKHKKDRPSEEDKKTTPSRSRCFFMIKIPLTI